MLAFFVPKSKCYECVAISGRSHWKVFQRWSLAISGRKKSFKFSVKMLFPATKQNVIEDCHVFYLKWSGPLCSSLMSATQQSIKRTISLGSKSQRKFQELTNPVHCLNSGPYKKETKTKQKRSFFLSTIFVLSLNHNDYTKKENLHPIQTW